MKIKFNGKEIELNNVKTVEDLIKEMDVKEKLFAIEKNMEIVARQDYSNTLLKEGDSIEVVTFLGGG